MDKHELFEKLAEEDLQQVSGGTVTQLSTSWMMYYIDKLKEFNATYDQAVDFFKYQLAYEKIPGFEMTEEEILQYLEEHWDKKNPAGNGD